MTLAPNSTRKREVRNHPPPLDMTLLGVPGISNPRRAIPVSAARPSIKESVVALGLNYSISSGGIPGLPPVRKASLPPRPLTKDLDSPFWDSSPNLILEISSASSHYATTDVSATSPKVSLSNLARLGTPIPLVSTRQKSVDEATRNSPPSHPISPVTPPLLTPAPARPTRRWGMTVFPESKAIRRVSSAPSSPISLNDAPNSPTSVIAIKSPMEWGDSRNISDAYPLASPFMTSLPRERELPPVPSVPKHIPPVPSIKPPTRQKPRPLPPPPTPEDPDGAETSRPAKKRPQSAQRRKSSLVAIKESGSSVKVEERQPRSPKIRTGPRSSRRASSHNKRIPSAQRRESPARRPNLRPLLKRDSGAPFAHTVPMETEDATESLSSLTEAEVAEVKEGRRNIRRWSASRRFLQSSSKRAKETVVMMRRGKKAEEKDIVSIIPQLRELKVPKRLRF
jgi:hypothetical protein